MRRSVTTGLALLVFLAGARADDKPDASDAQKKTAKENWEKLENTPPAIAETSNFLLVAPKEMEEKLKEFGELLDKHHEVIAKGLFTGKNEVPFKGKMTIYFLPKEEQIGTFIRRIEKRRPVGQEKGTFSAEDGKLHVAVAPPGEKTDPPIEVQAAQQMASALLQRKAGKSTILPHWLLAGYGRATYYRVAGPKERTVSAERGIANRIIRQTKRNAQDVWSNSLEGDDQTLEPSLAYFLAYGPARMKFPALIAGFAPGENEDKKTMEQALQAADLKVDLINKRFRDWVIRPD